MLFNSLEFLLLFLPIVLGVSLSVRGRALLAWIAFSSLVFYAFTGHAWFLAPMAVTSALDYFVGRQLERCPGSHRLPYLLLSLVSNLGLLAYFKYGGLFARTAAAWTGSVAHTAWLQVVLPAGISFYTFQTMSYVIDIYRGQAHAERSFLAYLSFVAFFPHLVAGPLTRHHQLIPQLHAIANNGVRPRWTAGIALFSVGLCKKILIADRLGSWLDPIVDHHLAASGAIGGWLALIGYALQIYFDFSGYSDMAVGLGRLFQIELPQNFDSPYQATDPSDFWRRWHITLSLWLRDYLYISLGGNRRGARRTQLNLLVTMTLGGLWHGANWTFAIWGLFHGAVLIAYHLTKQRWERSSHLARRVVTFALVCAGWVFFRAHTLSDAGTWFATLAGVHGFGALDLTDVKLALWGVGGLIICNAFPNAFAFDWEKIGSPRAVLLAGGTAASIVLMNYSSKFLYFQF